MADDKEDPIQQAASAEIKRQAERDRGAKVPMPQRIADELTRIRFEMTAIRELMARLLAEQLKTKR